MVIGGFMLVFGVVVIVIRVLVGVIVLRLVFFIGVNLVGKVYLVVLLYG